MTTRSSDLPRSFFARDAETVARELLGCLLVRRLPDGDRICRIVETEAYVGAHDLACHASKGRTPRTDPMFGEAGHAYVYFVYGMHHLLNVVTGPVGDPQAVLVRGAEPWPCTGMRDTRFAGPAKLCKTLEITTQAHNRLDVCSGGDVVFCRRPEPVGEVGATARIGVDYAKEWAQAPLRFYVRGSSGVSGPTAARR